VDKCYTCQHIGVGCRLTGHTFSSDPLRPLLHNASDATPEEIELWRSSIPARVTQSPFGESSDSSSSRATSRLSFHTNIQSTTQDSTYLSGQGVLHPRCDSSLSLSSPYTYMLNSMRSIWIDHVMCTWRDELDTSAHPSDILHACRPLLILSPSPTLVSFTAPSNCSSSSSSPHHRPIPILNKDLM